MEVKMTIIQHIKKIKMSRCNSSLSTSSYDALFEYKFLLLIVSLLAFFSISCKTPELSLSDQKTKAEKAIETARSVNAEQYAPDEFDNAVASYETGNEKAAQNDNAKANNDYASAIKYADEAYKKSLPSFVKNMIDETEEMIVEAKKTLKNVSLLEKTVELNEEAKVLYEDKNYIAARDKTLESRNSIELAYRYAEEEQRRIEEISDQRSLRENERYYRVKLNTEDRDCLWKIAERELGNPFAWKNIYNRNDDIINDPNLIYPDQQLILPDPNILY